MSAAGKQSAWTRAWRAFRANRFLQAALALYALIFLALAIAPYNRFDWFLEHLLIWITLLALAASYPFFKFTNLSYGLVLLFLVLHTVGAHYSYNETPVDAWIKAWLHTERNPYDRVVHFAFGLLLVLPFREIAAGWMAVPRQWASVTAGAFIMACAAAYELIEMWVAKLTAPEIGTLFLGMQGDVWDTQRDMEMALYGLLLALLLRALCSRAARWYDSG